MTNTEKGKLYISGIAVKEGISKNNRKYVAKELDKFAKTLKKRPIMKDHSGTTDSVIGKVTEASSIDNGKIVIYKGWVKGEDIIEKIKDGRISEVSIGAFSRRIVRDKEDENVMIPIDMEAMELSVTPIPGVNGTSVMPQENSSNYNINPAKINDNTQINTNTHKDESTVELEHFKEKESQELNNKKEHLKYNKMVDYKLIAELQTQIEALKKKTNVSNEDVSTSEDFDGYVMEQSESGRGYSFFKYY